MMASEWADKLYDKMARCLTNGEAKELLDAAAEEEIVATWRYLKHMGALPLSTELVDPKKFVESVMKFQQRESERVLDKRGR